VCVICMCVVLCVCVYTYMRIHGVSVCLDWNASVECLRETWHVCLRVYVVGMCVCVFLYVYIYICAYIASACVLTGMPERNVSERPGRCVCVCMCAVYVCCVYLCFVYLCVYTCTYTHAYMV